VADEPGSAGAPLRLLVVCTANRCRSPLAAGLLSRGLTGAEGVVVDSAGLLVGGHSADPLTVLAGRELGVDLDGHLSRRVSVDDLRTTDLLLTMERRHLRELAVLHPPVLRRSFTLPELVRRADATGQALSSAVLETLALGRTTRDLLLEDAQDAVADPVGQSIEVHRATAARLLALTDHLLALFRAAV
jgi:protein-tyrosine phosphatase